MSTIGLNEKDKLNPNDPVRRELERIERAVEDANRKLDQLEGEVANVLQAIAAERFEGYR